MKILPLLRGTAALALGLAALHAQAQLPAELAQQKNCLNCHQIDSKLVGPPYKEVAAKYKGDAGAENRLVKKVLEGGYGNWGTIPMPANPITEAEAHILVKWVLSQ